jgi:hypothetical protein
VGLLSNRSKIADKLAPASKVSRHLKVFQSKFAFAQASLAAFSSSSVL